MRKRTIEDYTHERTLVLEIVALVANDIDLVCEGIELVSDIFEPVVEAVTRLACGHLGCCACWLQMLVLWE